MKLSHLTSGLSNQYAGQKSFVEELSSSLASSHIDQKVFSLATRDWLKGGSKDWHGPEASACKIVGPDAFGFSQEMKRRIFADNCDLIHVHGLWMYPAKLANDWHAATSKPYVYSPHGMLSPHALRFSRAKKIVAEHLFQRSALKNAACIHATSENELLDVRRFGLKNPVAVLPPGITTSTPPVVAKVRTVLFLGRIHPIKGLDPLIKAWDALAPRSWTLKIIGPDETGYKSMLLELIKARSITNVEFAEPVYGLNRDRELAAASLLVLPSDSENYGMVVPEALMMGTPVIATRGTPWSGLVDHDCGAWIEQAQLQETLADYLEMPLESLGKKGQNGREWVLSALSWNELRTQYLDTYSWLMGNAQAPGWVHFD